MLLVEVGPRLVDAEDYTERVPLGVQLGQLFAGQVALRLGRLDLRLDLIGEAGVLPADFAVPVVVAGDSHFGRSMFKMSNSLTRVGPCSVRKET